MRGNEIIVTANPRGVFEEGIVAAGETHYPGMLLQRDPSVALKGGRFTYKIPVIAADGGLPKGKLWLVRGDAMLGKIATSSFAAGEKLFLYAPLKGEEVNLLLADIAGTGDDHTVGEMLILKNSTGKLIATTGSPAQNVAQLLETVTDPTTDTLAWCQWSTD